MNRTLMHSTRIAIQIVVDDTTGNVAALVMALAFVFGLLVKLGQLINLTGLFIQDFTEAYRFTFIVFTIGFKALAFGMGVRV